MMKYIMKIAKHLSRPRRFLLIVCRKLGIDKTWSDEKYVRVMYRAELGRKLNLENPRRFTEKMQWLKLYNQKEEYTVMVDKYEAPKYVAQKIGEQYIIPCIGVWESVEEIDFSKLPQKFVLKTTHDSGGIVICRDKSTLDLEAAKKLLNERLSFNYYLSSREWPYKNVKPRIIAEEYLENDSKEGLHDYKVWCFNGKAIYVQYITGRIAEKTYEGFYDREWNLQNFSFHNPLMKEPVEKPDKLEELLDAAEKLAAGIPFSRIDFYILPDGRIKFGEITFYPMTGIENWHPDEQDEIMGQMIELPKKCDGTI